MQKDNFKLFLKFGERSKHEKVCQAIDFKRFLELFQKNGEYCGLIYKINQGQAKIERLTFWNTYQNPEKLDL